MQMNINLKYGYLTRVFPTRMWVVYLVAYQTCARTHQAGVQGENFFRDIIDDRARDVPEYRTDSLVYT